MTAILNQVITGAVSNALSPIMQMRDGNPESSVIQGLLTYGSGGATINAWVQTSFDGGFPGATWCDVANFSFTTASARFLFNLSALTPVTTQYTPTDGTLGANTAKDGLLGPWWRVKYTTTGTYAGNTILRIDISALFGRLTSYSA